MALPADFGTGHVTGTFVTLAGVAVAGWLEFSLDPEIGALIDAAYDTVVMPSTLIVNLVSGAFAVDLPATDDPDIEPHDISYRVVEKFSNATGRSYRVVVPVGVTTDISDAIV